MTYIPMISGRIRYRKLAAILTCLFDVISALAGANELPVISKFTCSLDESQKRITVHYDIHDTDDQVIEILLVVLDDKGNICNVEMGNLKGDIGYPVRVGRKKRVFWHYDDSVPASVLKKFRIKLIADDRRGNSVDQLVSQIDTAYMRKALTHIYGIRNYEDLEGRKQIERTKAFISEELEKHGFRVSRQSFTYLNHTPENIIATLGGGSLRNEVFVLGAHFDTVIDSPGADDNGSGLIGMLEVARLLGKLSYERSLEFVGFDLEEYGHLGSQAYVKGVAMDTARKTLGCINFDMIGYYSDQPNSQRFPKGFDKVFPNVHKAVLQDSMKGNFAVVVANEYSLDLQQKYEKAIRNHVQQLKSISLLLPGTGQAFPDLRRSDHASFWDSGISALYIGDGAYSRNPFYHKPGDTMSAINMNHICNVVKATVAMLAECGVIRNSVSIEGSVN